MWSAIFYYLDIWTQLTLQIVHKELVQLSAKELRSNEVMRKQMFIRKNCYQNFFVVCFSMRICQIFTSSIHLPSWINSSF